MCGLMDYFLILILNPSQIWSTPQGSASLSTSIREQCIFYHLFLLNIGEDINAYNEMTDMVKRRIHYLRSMTYSVPMTRHSVFINNLYEHRNVRPTYHGPVYCISCSLPGVISDRVKLCVSRARIPLLADSGRTTAPPSGKVTSPL